MNNTSVDQSNEVSPLLRPWFLYPVATSYILIAAVAVIGNLLVCFAILANKSLRSKPTNLFLLSLAMSDFLTSAIAMPFDIFSIMITIFRLITLPHFFSSKLSKSFLPSILVFEKDAIEKQEVEIQLSPERLQQLFKVNSIAVRPMSRTLECSGSFSSQQGNDYYVLAFARSVTYCKVRRKDVMSMTGSSYNHMLCNCYCYNDNNDNNNNNNTKITLFID